MRFQLLISCENDAFTVNGSWSTSEEVARILENLAANMYAQQGASVGEHAVHDVNGNRVGTWAYVEDDLVSLA